ncbi:MAG: hypothetical protein A3G34_10115 [Candidatus Lindowbacteria bacterium RIFCSPLOWO2_12_FULL_62_27]|nr:MAG: hypothetical protein A3G34_10115 [Candidatus Lindowbacteria bacterium RIFCSPLOWO2_12_FULL_62_27]OGH61594.1 MAG: hypothetical protein A3I06_03125 [Candidatus Lindowbacteria bacterium RIFCSPLOWO2_02_FULL_62_12]
MTPVLNRMASFVRPAGLFAGTFFHGKGEGVYHGSFVPGRFFARYLKDELQSHVENAGWRIRWIHTVANEERRGRWIQVIAEKR